LRPPNSIGAYKGVWSMHLLNFIALNAVLTKIKLQKGGFLGRTIEK